MESKALKFLTEHMKAVTAGDDPYGSKILDRKRNVIGYWYAPPRRTTIKFGKKGVNIYPPEVSDDYHGGGD